MHFASRQARRAHHRLLPSTADRAAPRRSSLPGNSLPGILLPGNSLPGNSLPGVLLPVRNPLGGRSPLSRRALAERQFQHAFWIERKPVPVWDVVRARSIP